MPDWLGRLAYLTLFFVVVNVAVYFGTNGEYYLRPGFGAGLFVLLGAGLWTRSKFRPIQHSDVRLPHDDPNAQPKYEQPMLSDWE